MNKVVLDDSAAGKLAGLSRGVQIYDSSGSVIGYFQPLVDQTAYENAEIAISEEEIRRREKELGGRMLDEILGDLENRQ